MTSPVLLSASRVQAIGVEDAFDRVLPAPLEQLFARRFLALPPIRRVTGQVGAWGTVGQTRVIETADGGTMREHLLRVDRPSGFAYEIGEVTGPMKPLVRAVEGRWDFEAAGTGTRVTWSWRVQPTGVGRVAMPAFSRMWHGYARRALEQLDTMLVP